MLVRSISAFEEETKWAMWLYHQHNQFIHVTDGVIVTSLSASLLQKISVAVDCLCQITLNRKLACTFGVNLQVALKQNHVKENVHVSGQFLLQTDIPLLQQWKQWFVALRSVSAHFWLCCAVAVSIHEAMGSLCYGYFVFIAVV